VAGPDFAFNSASNIGVDVLPEHRNVLFEGDEALYAAVPELRPRRAVRT
jgi:hypothetical protein